jgi:hypothetical protein
MTASISRLAELPPSLVVDKIRQEVNLRHLGARQPLDVKTLAFRSCQGDWEHKHYELEQISPAGDARKAGVIRYERALAGDALRMYVAVVLDEGPTYEAWETDADPGVLRFAVEGEPAGSMRWRRRARREPRTLFQWLWQCCAVKVWGVYDAGSQRRGLVRLQYPVDKDSPYLFYRTRQREKLLICGACRPAVLSHKLEQRLHRYGYRPPGGFEIGAEDWVLPRETPASNLVDEQLLFFMNIVVRTHVLQLEPSGA